MKTLTRLAIVLRLLLAPAAWAQTFTLGTTNLLESCTAGSDSVVLAANGTWTATTNASWLHLSAANQSGMGTSQVGNSTSAENLFLNQSYLWSKVCSKSSKRVVLE